MKSKKNIAILFLLILSFFKTDSKAQESPKNTKEKQPIVGTWISEDKNMPVVHIRCLA